MNEKSEREAFEVWISGSGRAHLLERNKTHGWYKDLAVTERWAAWIARAALAPAAGEAPSEQQKGTIRLAIDVCMSHGYTNIADGLSAILSAAPAPVAAPAINPAYKSVPLMMDHGTDSGVLAPASGEAGAEPDTSQDWAKLDGTVAYHLIDRHGEDWADIGAKMEAWGKARYATPIAADHMEQARGMVGQMRISDADVRAWATRNCIDLGITDLRAALEDAQTLATPPLAESLQGDMAGASEAAQVRTQAFEDCIDTIRGAIAFGQQNTNPPPDGEWLNEFWNIGRRLATPQGENNG